MSGEVSNRSRYAHNPIKEWTKKLNAKIRVLRVYSLHPMTTQSMTTQSPNLHPLIVHSLSTLCPLIVHSLSTHCLLIVHSLPIHCPLIVQSLSTDCPLIVHSLSTHCPLIVDSLSSCVFIVHSLSHHFPLIVSSLSQKDNGTSSKSCHGTGRAMAACQNPGWEVGRDGTINMFFYDFPF